jgi:hypothetical protein
MAATHINRYSILSTDTDRHMSEKRIKGPFDLNGPYFQIKNINMAPKSIMEAAQALQTELRDNWSVYLDAYSMEFTMDFENNSILLTGRVSAEEWFKLVQHLPNFPDIWTIYCKVNQQTMDYNESRTLGKSDDLQPMGIYMPVYKCETMSDLCNGSERECGHRIYNNSLLLSDDQLHIGIRRELARQITISPVKHQTNEQLINDITWWERIMQIAYSLRPTNMQVNFGSWESFVQKNNNIRNCHGHFHFNFNVSGWTTASRHEEFWKSPESMKLLQQCFKPPTNYAWKDFVALRSLYRKEYLLEVINEKLV